MSKKAIVRPEFVKVTKKNEVTENTKAPHLTELRKMYCSEATV